MNFHMPAQYRTNHEFLAGLRRAYSTSVQVGEAAKAA